MEENIFEEMFNWNNERYLHSSFIAMLLSQFMKEQHNYSFFDLFLKHLHRENHTILPSLFPHDKCEVYPNITQHREIKNIDLLIISKDTQSVIIIENKTLSPDRIIAGKHQLLFYGEDFKRYKHIFYVYLSPRKFLPTRIDSFQNKNLTTISYDLFIRDWLQDCIKVGIFHSKFQKEIVCQYFNFLKNHLNDPREAERLRKEIIKDVKAAQEQYKNSEFPKTFVHVKWATIYEILESIYNTITSLSSFSEEENRNFMDIKRYFHDYSTKLSTGESVTLKFTFKINGTELYLCNDKKGFTLGRCDHLPGESYFEFLNSPQNYCNLKDFNKNPLPEYIWSLIAKQSDITTELQQTIPQAIEKLTQY